MKEDHERDAAFHKAMHGKSAAQKSAFMAMINKDSKSQQAAADAYFKHWDNKDAKTETEKDREVYKPHLKSTATAQGADVYPGSQSRLCKPHSKVCILPAPERQLLIQQYSYYDLATGLYEEGYGQSFHFCRFAANEPFKQAIARHEHYLAARIGLKKGMKVLDVGCGVGGPAREIAKFADVHITGLNINDYQIERATRAAGIYGLSNQLEFVKGDFMVSNDNCFCEY